MGHRAYKGKGDGRVNLSGGRHGGSISEAQKLCERDWEAALKGARAQQEALR